MRRLFILAVAVALMTVATAPAGAGPGKVIKQTGKDATTMSAERVWANGGPYLNACVTAAIAQGYKGKVNMIQPAGNVDIILGMSFGNLDPGSYTVHLDDDGGSPGGWDVIGSFVADEFGDGSFNYKVPADELGDGTHNWAIYVNNPGGGCATILQTDVDLNFITGS